MPSRKIIKSHKGIRQGLAKASTREMKEAIRNRVRQMGDIAILVQQALQSSDVGRNEPGQVTRPQTQPAGEISTGTAVQLPENTYLKASSDRDLVARDILQQRLQHTDSKIATRKATIEAIKTQIGMVRAQQAAQGVHFDMLDAIDMQVEDERRLTPAATATMSAARHERDAQRAAGTITIKGLIAELVHHAACTTRAKRRLARARRRDALLVARLELRDLAALRAAGATTLGCERGVAFWSAVRRASSSARPAVLDVLAYESYARELELPLLELICGMPAAPEVVQAIPHLGDEEGGLYSFGGWQL